MSFAGVLGRRGRTVVGVLGVVAMLAAANAAGAADVSTTLDTLLSGGTNEAGLVLGDKRYSNFTFSSSGPGRVSAGGVDVLLSSDDGNRYNLRFNFRRETLAADPLESTDVVIAYRVDVLGTQRINGVGLSFDSLIGTGGTPGLAAASVVETVRTVDGSDLSPGGDARDMEVIGVFNDGSGGLPDETLATLAVNPTSSLLFQKDILVSAREGGGTVEISVVTNFVNQVPEPSSAALLALGGVALLTRRRRRDGRG